MVTAFLADTLWFADIYATVNHAWMIKKWNPFPVITARLRTTTMQKLGTSLSKEFRRISIKTHQRLEHLNRPINIMTWFEGITKPKFKMSMPFRRQISPEFMRPRNLDCPSVFAASGNFHRRSTAQVKDTAKKNGQLKVTLSAHSSFQRAVGSILVTGQLFGLMPVYGVLGSTPGTVHFKTWSVRTVYAVFVLLCLLVVEAISIQHMILTLTAKTLGMIGGIGAATACAMFYGNALVGTVLFLRLAPKWPLLMSSWNNMESVLDRSRQSSSPISLKFSLLTALILLLALGEHVLSTINSIPVFLDKHWHYHPDSPTPMTLLTTASTATQSSATTTDLTTTSIATTPSLPVNESDVIDEFLTEYCLKSNTCIFKYVQYNTAYGIAMFIISKISTFTWNFTDLFLVLISTALSERFKQFNKALLRINHMEVSAVEWGQFRSYFATLSAHSKNVDNYISGIVFASFANNLYFICLQLLNGLNPNLTNLIDRLYFFYSFAFLLARTILVTLVAAQINFSSKQALCVLFNCPPKAYCIEAQRLQYQMTADDISLSGMGFFSITRNFMLSVAAAIATYEIVLLQFNAVSREDMANASVNVSAYGITKS